MKFFFFQLLHFRMLLNMNWGSFLKETPTSTSGQVYLMNLEFPQNENIFSNLKKENYPN